jgi:hypothetical protein
MIDRRDFMNQLLPLFTKLFSNLFFITLIPNLSHYCISHSIFLCLINIFCSSIISFCYLQSITILLCFFIFFISFPYISPYSIHWFLSFGNSFLFYYFLLFLSFYPFPLYLFLFLSPFLSLFLFTSFSFTLSLPCLQNKVSFSQL